MMTMIFFFHWHKVYFQTRYSETPVIWYSDAAIDLPEDILENEYLPGEGEQG